MLSVLVPTGIVTHTSTASGTRPVVFTCYHCGATQTLPLEIKASASSMYHVFNSSKKKAAKQDASREQAMSLLIDADERLAHRINDEHEYGYIRYLLRADATCSRCGAVQPWSSMPRPWRPEEHRIWKLVIGLLIALAVFSPFVLVPAFAEAALAMPMLILAAVLTVLYLGLLIALPFIYRAHFIRKHERAMEQLKTQSFEPPLYVSASMLRAQAAASGAAQSSYAMPAQAPGVASIQTPGAAPVQATGAMVTPPSDAMPAQQPSGAFAQRLNAMPAQILPTVPPHALNAAPAQTPSAVTFQVSNAAAACTQQAARPASAQEQSAVERSGWFCPHCGTPQAADANFCNACGTPRP